MSSIILHHVDFAYPSATVGVFSDLSLLIDTSWRTGVVGRNGQGKSTLLGLIGGRLKASAGHLEVPVTPRWFPGAEPAAHCVTLDAVRDAVAPFGAWERTMAQLLDDGSTEALERYGDLHERYLAFDGYGIEARIAREFDAMQLSPTLLERPFGTLSGGEQTRALIAALFIGRGAYPLIDEPTNHLDRSGREALMRYLASRRGFLLVSHDRELLDGAVDHVLSINRSDVRLTVGNYSQWRTGMEAELEAERRQRQHLERDIARLEAAARETRQHAASREADKYRTGALDKGFIGHRAARQMQRARNVERRIRLEIDSRRRLLRNAEKSRRLSVSTQSSTRQALVTVQNVTVTRGGRSLFHNLSFTIAPGERIAVVGANGSGKTTLLDLVSGAVSADRGLVRRPARIVLSRAYQQPLWQSGTLRDHLDRASLDETRFRQLLGVLGVGGEVFDRELSTFSQGQLKKVDLCRCLLEDSDLLLWDEPLNWVDVLSREQIEEAVLEHQPTLLFVEHDQRFVERVATRMLILNQS